MENIYKNSIVRTVSTKTVYSIEYRVSSQNKERKKSTEDKVQ
jgi:hypothetical protein